MLSIVIPVHNEAEVLPALLARLWTTGQKLDGSFELLFVDDGSRDDSVAILMAARQRQPEIRVLQLSRNFGKEAAVSAGLEHAPAARPWCLWMQTFRIPPRTDSRHACRMAQRGGRCRADETPIPGRRKLA